MDTAILRKRKREGILKWNDQERVRLPHFTIWAFSWFIIANCSTFSTSLLTFQGIPRASDWLDGWSGFNKNSLKESSNKNMTYKEIFLTVNITEIFSMTMRIKHFYG